MLVPGRIGRSSKADLVAMILMRILLLIAVILLVGVVAGFQAPTANPPLPAQGVQVAPPSELSASELQTYGDTFRAHKDYASALKYYEAAAAKTPKDSKVWNHLGMVNLQLTKYDAAKRNFESAIKLNKTLVEAYNNLGVAYYALRNYKKAIRQYEKALALKEDSASFHSNLGAAYFARKQFDKATAEYGRALQLDPEVFERSSATGLCAHLASPEDRAHYAFVMAKLYAKAGDFERALEQLKKAIEYGYSRVKDVYEEQEFAELRKEQRFAELMGNKPPAVPQ